MTLARIALMTAAVLAPALARADGDTLPPITVTESRPAPDLSTVVPEEIDSALTPSLGELLRLVPGVHLDRSGASGAVSSLYLRGAEANYTAVFLDGVRINDPTNTRGGSYDFATLTDEDLERIEVVRGPVSARYGSDAMAGAVNLVSARGTSEGRVLAGVGAGDDGYEHGRAAVRGMAGLADYGLGAAWTDSGRATPDSSARLGSANANLGYAPDASSDLRATVHFGDAQLQAFPEDSGGTRYAVHRELEQRDVRQWVGSVSYRTLFPDGVAAGVRAGYYHRAEDNDSPGVAPGVRDPAGIPASVSQDRFDRYDATTTLEGRLAGTQFVAGLEGLRESGASDTMFQGFGSASFALRRDDGAAFLDADRVFDLARVEASVRVDAPQGYGAVTTPRLRVSRTFGAWTASASAGDGFKLPSFFALGNPVVGNPDLKPERSRGYELDLTRPLGPATLSLAGFRARYRDAIDFDEGPPPRLVNRGAMVSSGGELGVRVDLGPRGHLRAHVAYADAHVEGTGERPRNRPRVTGALQARVEPAAPVVLLAGLTYVGENRDSSIPTGDRQLPSYTRVDAGIGWLPAIGFGAMLSVENLLNRGYDELLGFPAARRSVRVSLEMKL